MAPDNSISTLLSKLTTSLDSAINVLPEPGTQSSVPNGISLLDVKSELLLSYLQNLVFLILVKIKNAQSDSTQPDEQNFNDEEDTGFKTNGLSDIQPSSSLISDAVNRLVELRVYLEKGVRPLESRLKYQIDKVIRAADNATRDAASATTKKPKPTKSTIRVNDMEDGSDQEELGQDDGDDDDEDSEASIDELAYRPNPAAFARNSSIAAANAQQNTANNKGVYRPPRITPTALPTSTNSATFDDGPLRARKTERSRTLDDYIASELTGAPTAEPSIGSNVVLGGQRTKTTREREKEAERRAYEESNFVRLPGQSKKDMKMGRQGRAAAEVWGGEEMRGLGEGADRIARLTKKRRDGGDVEDRGQGNRGKRRRVGGR